MRHIARRQVDERSRRGECRRIHYSGNADIAYIVIGTEIIGYCSVKAAAGGSFIVIRHEIQLYVVVVLKPLVAPVRRVSENGRALLV